MAVTFRRGPRTLIKKINQSGYRIANLSGDTGDPNRSLQISLQNGVVVNWDRDSYSVWAQGPEPLSSKVEALLASRHRSRRSRKKSSSAHAWVMLLLMTLLLGGLVAVAWENASHAPTEPPASDTASYDRKF